MVQLPGRVGNFPVLLHPLFKNDIFLVISDTYCNSDIKLNHTLFYKESVVTEFADNKYRLFEPRLWSVKKPNLYTLKTLLKSKDGEEEYTVRFGFREAIFKPDGFYLNGE